MTINFGWWILLCWLVETSPLMTLDFLDEIIIAVVILVRSLPNTAQ